MRGQLWQKQQQLTGTDPQPKAVRESVIDSCLPIDAKGAVCQEPAPGNFSPLLLNEVEHRSVKFPASKSWRMVLTKAGGRFMVFPGA